MRAFISVIVVAMLTGNTLSNASGKGRRSAQQVATKTESSEKKRAAETAYQKALQAIPNSNEKPDPWKGVRIH